MTHYSHPHRSLYPSEQDEAVARRYLEVFEVQETLIATLERENRKLTDKLNRYRNLTPGRKRLYSLGRIAGSVEHIVDEMVVVLEAMNNDPDSDYHKFASRDIANGRADAIYLRRLQWDLEQLREVVYPSEQPVHEWRRP